MKFTEKLLKRSLINDVENYPNFFSNIWKIPNQNKLFILIIWEKEIPQWIYEAIRLVLSDYEIKFVNPNEIALYLLKYQPYSITYNGFHYDDVLTKYLINNSNNKNILSDLYKITQWSIEQKGTKHLYSKYKYNKSLRGIDLMRVSGLDRIFKPLKQAAANLRHEKIQDLPIKPGTMIKENEIANIIVYELNDVLITEKLLLGIPEHHISPTVPKTAYNGLLEAIDFRYEIGKKFDSDLLNLNKSQIGERLASNLYSKASGRSPEEFKSQQTNRKLIHYDEIIFDIIEFKTSKLKDFLSNLKELMYEPYGNSEHKKQFKIEFELWGLNVVFAQGGLHAVSINKKIFKNSKILTLRDLDVSSFYPSLYWKYNIEPEHLPNFNDFVGDIIKLRLNYKKEGNKLFANGLKLGINRIYGGFSDDYGWLKDVKALLQTTINGQLMLLMLIEDLHLEGISTYYANTDGITVECPNNKIVNLERVWKDWEIKLNMVLEVDNFKNSYIRDVNNFIGIKVDGAIKLKGAYEFSGYLEKYGEFDLTGSFNNPIVPYAVVQYFTKHIPIKETITNHIKNYPYDGIYDFCIAKKANKQFTNQLFTISDKTKFEIIQQSVRYYISNSNQKLFKVKNKTDRELLGLIKQSKSKRNNLSNIYFISNTIQSKGILIKEIKNVGFIYMLEQGSMIMSNPKKEWLHYDELEADENITMFNDYFKSNNYDINYTYYIREAQKLINGIEKKNIILEKIEQLKLV